MTGDRIHPVCGKCSKSRSKLKCRYQATRFRQSLLSILTRGSSTTTDSGSTSGSGPSFGEDGSPISNGNGSGDEISPPASNHDIDNSLNEEPDLPHTRTGHHSGNDKISPQDVIPALANSPLPSSSHSHVRWHSSFSSSDVAYPGPLGGHDSPEQLVSVRRNQKQVHIGEADSNLFHYYLTHAGVWVR